MTLLTTAANVAWFTSCLPAYAAFRSALHDPRAAQLRVLKRYLGNNSKTDFGRAHHLEKVQELSGFRQNVPIRRYDDFTPWIDQIRRGGQRELSTDVVTRLIPSSGSTCAAKLIPYTNRLQREFNRAIGPWIVDLYRAMPGLMCGSAFWSITPATQNRSYDSVVPVGFDDDSAYLGGMRRRLVDSIQAVGPEVCGVGSMDGFRFATLCHLLRRRDLRLMSVWHPSFLELLLNEARRRWDEMLEDIRRTDPARAAVLRDIDVGDWHSVWPNLRLISCWADGNAASAAATLQSHLPRAVIQPKGLLATEAFVSIPFAGQWPLAVNSHFFEFEDDDGRLFLADELRPGGEYGVIVTTGGGLWRYRLGDRIRCHGRLGRTPSVRLIGRNDLVVDRFGEKLNEAFVGAAIRRVLAEAKIAADFAMLAPDGCDANHYTLFISTHSSISRLADELATNLDAAFRANPHYAYCRDLCQLGPLRIFQIGGNGYPAFRSDLRAWPAARRYQTHRARLGGRLVTAFQRVLPHGA